MSFSNVETIFSVIFCYIETKDNAIKSQKRNKIETMKTKVMEFDTAHHFMLNYHTKKIETFC